MLNRDTLSHSGIFLFESLSSISFGEYFSAFFFENSNERLERKANIKNKTQINSQMKSNETTVWTKQNQQTTSLREKKTDKSTSPQVERKQFFTMEELYENKLPI